MTLIKYLPLFLSLAIASACQTTRYIPADTIDRDPIEFILLQLNDVYEISPLDAGRVGGIARVAGIYEQLKRKNPHTLAMLSGDFLSPSLISSLSETIEGRRKRIAGAQMVDALNAAGLDYATFGNHEFDTDGSSLQQRLDEANFTFVSSNVKHRTADQAQPFTQRGRPIPDYTVHTFESDTGRSLRLGIMGLTLPFNQQKYVHYDDVFDAARTSFDAVSQESDLVVAITHLTLEDDIHLAEALPDLALIVGGHEHTDTLTVVGSTPIAKADANARTVYIHWITYYPATGETDVWSQLMPVTDDIAPAPEAGRLVAEWESRADQLIREMGYEANDAIASFQTPLDGRESAIRNEQTSLGRLIACAMLDADSTAEFAFLNSGGIRIDDQVQGQILQRDILRTLPFGGSLVHGQFRGDVLERVLRAGLITNKNEGGYFQTTANVARRGDAFFIDGAPIEADETYEAVLPEFLSLGLEANLGFMKDEATYQPLSMTRMNGRPGSDLRDVLIQYLKDVDWLNDCPLATAASE